MADISDVENALVTLLAGILQMPSGYASGAAGTAATVGAQCKIYRGWPERSVLDADLAAGTTHVSIFPPPGMTRRLPGYLLEWRPGPTPVTPTLAASVTGTVVSFGGTGGAGQVVGIRITGQAGDTTYAYRLLSTDTPASVAAAFAGLITGASAASNVLTIPSFPEGPTTVQTIVVADQPAWMETRRQEQALWICIWSPTPLLRDLFGGAVDGGIANMQDQWGRQTIQFGLPDGSNALIRYSNSRTDDAPQQANLWRRDLRYLLNFPTTLLQMQPTVIFAGATVSVNGETVDVGDLQPT